MSRHIRTQVVTAHSVFDIDFDQLNKNGITCALFDIESTIAPWGASRTSEKMQQYLRSIAVSKKGIVTNIHASHADRVVGFARQIDAQSWQYPTTFRRRKPGGAMIIDSMRALDAPPDQTVMIGDKLFDVLAAKNAGVSLVIWVDKLPGPDHWFDKYVYRAVEPLFKRLLVTK